MHLRVFIGWELGHDAAFCLLLSTRSDSFMAIDSLLPVPSPGSIFDRKIADFSIDEGGTSGPPSNPPTTCFFLTRRRAIPYGGIGLGILTFTVRKHVPTYVNELGLAAASCLLLLLLYAFDRSLGEQCRDATIQK